MKNDPAELKRYFMKKKEEMDQAEALLEQKAKAVTVFQKTVEERYQKALEKEEDFRKWESALMVRQNWIFEREAFLQKESKSRNQADWKWESEKQEILQNARAEAESTQSALQAARNEIVRLQGENRILEERIRQLQEEKNQLLKKLL